MTASTPEFTWQFQKMGRLNQVEFTTGDAVRRLRELDPKLWVALACPAKGLEFDQRCLTLLDADRDGRIRIPEIIAAAEWTCARLKNPDSLLNPGPGLPLDAIDDSAPAGRRLAATAKAVLAGFGSADAAAIGAADVAQAILHASEQLYNGDGVLPPSPALDEDVRAFIRDAVAVAGGVEDVGGVVGANAAVADTFMRSLAGWRDWNDMVAKAEAPLGKDTSQCWQLVAELKAKIDDYFLRCELAAYAPSAQARLNREDQPLGDGNALFAQNALAELPLAQAGPNRPLDLASGLNPAWREKVERLAGLVGGLLETPGKLSRNDWLSLQKTLEPFAEVMGRRPAPAAAPGVTAPPVKQVDELGGDRIQELLSGDAAARFAVLAQKDADGPAAATDIADMERLVLYYLHLHRLLRNFVNFSDFYDAGHTATFQSGSLYIDGRSCHLCMPAEDVDAHSEMAKNSQLYLLYCKCSRGRKPGTADPEETRNIVAAVTAGSSDLLTVGRNGVFVDAKGDDWDATVVKIVSNPIGVWQAVWSPYKQFGNLVTEQIARFASEKQAALMDSASQAISTAGTDVAAGTAPKFDIAKNVGMFAAVGLALGAIGTAVGSIFNALLSMAWWQLPLVFLGLFALISGPSAIMAYLKLRQRTLGPLLEASGWAINGQVALTWHVAKRLSALAKLPPNAKRTAHPEEPGAKAQ